MSEPLKINYRRVTKVKVVRVNKSYIIKEFLDKKGRVITNEVLNFGEKTETISDLKYTKLIETVYLLSPKCSETEIKNEYAFTNGEMDETQADVLISSNFEFNSELESIKSEEKKSMSASINSILNEAAKHRFKTEKQEEKTEGEESEQKNEKIKLGYYSN